MSNNQSFHLNLNHNVSFLPTVACAWSSQVTDEAHVHFNVALAAQ